MTSVKQKDHGSSCLAAMPLSETYLSVAPWSSQEWLTSLWRYLQHITNFIQKLETAPDPLPQRRTSPVAVLKGKLIKCLFLLQAWTDLSLFPPRVTVHFTELCFIPVPSNNDQPQSAVQLSNTVWECTQLNAVTIRWEEARQILHCNSFVLPCLPFSRATEDQWIKVILS